METSLHRELKARYAANAESTEVVVDQFRIDAIDKHGALVEVQHAGLGSIRRKMQVLLEQYEVRLIKPLIRQKTLEKIDPKSLKVLSKRRSPKRAEHLDIFGELIHFTSVFPHGNLRLEVPLLDIVEKRVPKVNRRWRRKQYKVVEQKIINIGETLILQTRDDLWQLIGAPAFEGVFGTDELAKHLDRPRWFAQQVAYVLLRCGVVEQQGKKGNSKLYCYQKPRVSRKRKVA